MSAEELKSSVAQLPAGELAAFSRWFEEFMADRWDRQIEADALAGKLDAMGQRADEDYQVGHCTFLSLHNETALLSEQALAEGWNRPEEDAAWSHLRPNR